MGAGHTRSVIGASVQGWVLPHLIACVESRRVNASPIRRLFGRTKLDDPNVRVPEAVTETAWRLAATLTCDDALGIHLAESLPRGALDLVEYALRSSPNLGKGLDRLARYGRLLSDRVAARTHRKGEGLLFLVHDTATTALHPARAEFALAVALKLVRDSTGADITPVRVSFAHRTKRIGRAEGQRARTGAKPDTSVEEPPMLRGIVRCRMSEAHADRCDVCSRTIARQLECHCHRKFCSCRV